jgi:DNA-binding GntR family transcriptional regulator
MMEAYHDQEPIMAVLKNKADTGRRGSGRNVTMGRPASNGGKREHAYQRLRRLLILQQIPPGSRLTEAEWAVRTGANRTALREAFARLEAEGLIQFGAKTGYVVPVITPEDIREVLDVRAALEGKAIELICRAGVNTADHLKRSVDSCSMMEQLVDDDYHVTTVEADRRFHEALIEAAGNRRLAIAYRHAPLMMVHPEITCGPEWTHRVRLTIQEHYAILEAIFRGDESGAQRLLRTHLYGNWES